MDEEATGLTENEGSLLALVRRREPVTAYELVKIYEQSPTTTINSSKGSVYPMIKRLKQRGLLAAARVPGDGRNAETLSCTDAGEAAVRRWVSDLRLEHTLIGDPMRTRVLSLEMLSRDEKIAWISEAKALTKRKRDELEAYAQSVSVPFQDVVHSSALEAVDGKLRWLDRLFYAVVSADAAER